MSVVTVVRYLRAGFSFLAIFFLFPLQAFAYESATKEAGASNYFLLSNHGAFSAEAPNAKYWDENCASQNCRRNAFLSESSTIINKDRKRLAIDSLDINKAYRVAYINFDPLVKGKIIEIQFLD